MNARCLALVLALAAPAAGCSGGAPTPTVTLEADVTVLQRLLGEDPARAVLSDVDDALDDERPVMAAQLIDDAALPAVRRQIDALAAAHLSTPEGRRLQARAVRIHRARAAALEVYRDVLAPGVTGADDAAVLEAMRGYRDAELDLLRLHDELARIRPLAEGANAAADREARLGGLPAIRHDERADLEGDADPIRPSGAPEEGAAAPQEPLPE